MSEALQGCFDAGVALRDSPSQGQQCLLSLSSSQSVGSCEALLELHKLQHLYQESQNSVHVVTCMSLTANRYGTCLEYSYDLQMGVSQNN